MFNDDIETKMLREISKEVPIDCELCYPPLTAAEKLDPKNLKAFDPKTFYLKPMTLQEYFKHEVYHEYEKAKRCIFDKDHNPISLDKKEGINELHVAPFHPIFMSSLMNQQVFKRECMIQEQKQKKIDNPV